MIKTVSPAADQQTVSNITALRQSYHSPQSSQDIFRTLKEELLSLAIKPGQLIREDETCSRFNASRPTVRAVFQRLADAGLTDLFPYRGVYASLIDLDLVRQIIHLRIITETKMMSDFIAQNPDPMIIEEIEHNIRQQEIMTSRSSFSAAEFLALDSDMHLIWFNECRCPGLWTLLQQQDIHYTRFKLLDLAETGQFQKIVSHHRSLLDAVQTKNPAHAQSILIEHLNGGISRMGSRIEGDFAGYFKTPSDADYWRSYYSL